MHLSSEEKLASAGYPYRPDLISKSMTRQQVKDAKNKYRQDDTSKPNRFPRGICAAKMLELGWEFKD